ncbi:MAG: c-type cytochrome [Pedobacter sp.]|nr:MAG: c-type cytochrome [Pedobacter sp.]
MKKYNLILTLSLLVGLWQPTLTFAQGTEYVTPDATIGLSTTEVLVISLLVFALALLLVSVVLFKAFKVFYQERNNPSLPTPPEPIKALPYLEWKNSKKGKPTLWTKLLSLRPIEEEKDLEIPHTYDEIKELNNPIPTWFNVLFYGTIIFGIGYYYYYHFSTGLRQDDEYELEMTMAAKAKIEYLAKSAEKYDENSVKVDAALIENGAKVYLANCTACHGDKGQGIVGPNLTDDHWIHGGSVNDIFKVIKYGVSDKGMTAWEKSLTSKQIAELANYIISLQGTNPPGAKAPQGIKYVPNTNTDSLSNEIVASTN